MVLVWAAAVSAKGLAPRRLRHRIPAQVLRALPHGSHARLPLLRRDSLPVRTHHLVPPALREPRHRRPVGARRSTPATAASSSAVCRPCMHARSWIGSRQRATCGWCPCRGSATPAAAGPRRCSAPPPDATTSTVPAEPSVSSSVCACIYSSVHGEWSKPTPVHHHTIYHSREDSMGNGPSALAGNALYLLLQRISGLAPESSSMIWELEKFLWFT